MSTGDSTAVRRTKNRESGGVLTHAIAEHDSMTIGRHARCGWTYARHQSEVMLSDEPNGERMYWIIWVLAIMRSVKSSVPHISLARCLSTSRCESEARLNSACKWCMCASGIRSYHVAYFGLCLPSHFLLPTFPTFPRYTTFSKFCSAATWRGQRRGNEVSGWLLEDWTPGG